MKRLPRPAPSLRGANDSERRSNLMYRDKDGFAFASQDNPRGVSRCGLQNLSTATALRLQDRRALSLRSHRPDAFGEREA